jgi:hypothetical protein
MRILKRLDRIEAAYVAQATMLRLEDGTRTILPRGAMIDVFLAFCNLIDEGDLAWAGEPIPVEWIEAFARSVPQPGEGQLTQTCREWSRRYLAGEELT